VIAAGAVALLALSGCMKMEMDVTIKSDDNVQVQALIGVSKETADMMAEMGEPLSIEDMCSESSTGIGSGGADYTVRDVSDADYMACEMSGTTTLADMDGSLERVDGTYVFTMTSDEEDADAGAAGAAMAAGMFDSFRVSVTFPGQVLEHNGSSKVDGTTVTWDDPRDMMAAEGLRAVGEATGSGGSSSGRETPVPISDDVASVDEDATSGISSLVWIVLAVVGLVVVAGIVTLVLVLRRKGKNAPASVQGYAPQAGQPQGYPQPAPGQPYPPQPGPQGYPQPGTPQGYPPQPAPGQPYPPQPGQPQGYPPQPGAAQPYPPQPEGQPQPPAPGQPYPPQPGQPQGYPQPGQPQGYPQPGQPQGYPQPGQPEQPPGAQPPYPGQQPPPA